MNLHVVSLPHTQTTTEYLHCAFTEKVRKFCDMMKPLGHTIYLYASEDNEAACDELITCITKEEQAELIGVTGPHDIYKPSFDPNDRHWILFNSRAIEAMRARAHPRDLVLVIGGYAHSPIAYALPEMMTVEFGVGYSGVFADYRVFESYAWMHTVYGELYGSHATRGRFYDRVIPNYFDPDAFEFKPKKDDYLMFIGRLNEDKGVGVAIDTAKALDMPLVVCGFGDYPLPSWVDYRGVVGVEERSKLMSSARAVLAPTLYLEPFGGVSVEPQFCGTPVITTDFGAFPENVIHGVTGFRCHTLKDFINAVKMVDALDPYECMAHAVQNFSMKVVGPKYDAYFNDLEDLWGAGWYST
jgi:glycosyltransferase involved in cell wall biosynthesis